MFVHSDFFILTLRVLFITSFNVKVLLFSFILSHDNLSEKDGWVCRSPCIQWGDLSLPCSYFLFKWGENIPWSSACAYALLASMCAELTIPPLIEQMLGSPQRSFKDPVYQTWWIHRRANNLKRKASWLLQKEHCEAQKSAQALIQADQKW